MYKKKVIYRYIYKKIYTQRDIIMEKNIYGVTYIERYTNKKTYSQNNI